MSEYFIVLCLTVSIDISNYVSYFTFHDSKYHRSAVQIECFISFISSKCEEFYEIILELAHN